MNGNVGIGTWLTNYLITVGTGAAPLGITTGQFQLGGDGSAILSQTTLNLYQDGTSIVENNDNNANDKIKNNQNAGYVGGSLTLQ